MIEEALPPQTEQSSPSQDAQGVDIEFPMRSPMAFLDYTTLVLSCVTSADELELVLQHFCAPDVLAYVDEHNETLNVLGTVFVATLQRVVYADPEGRFPYGALALPQLFARWGWQLEMNDTWRDIHLDLLERLDLLEAKDDAFWPVLSRLLLLDALANGTDAAQTKLRARLAKASPCREGIHPVLELGQVLGQLGW